MEKFVYRYIYETGTLNGGAILQDRKVGIFKVEGYFQEEEDKTVRFWSVKGTRHQYYSKSYDTYEEAKAAYLADAGRIIKMYGDRINELLTAVDATKE